MTGWSEYHHFKPCSFTAAQTLCHVWLSPGFKWILGSQSVQTDNQKKNDCTQYAACTGKTEWFKLFAGFAAVTTIILRKGSAKVVEMGKMWLVRSSSQVLASQVHPTDCLVSCGTYLFESDASCRVIRVFVKHVAKQIFLNNFVWKPFWKTSWLFPL